MTNLLSSYETSELLAAEHATELCIAHAKVYAKNDVDAATIAALWLALELEAKRQGMKMTVTFNNAQNERFA